MSLSIWEILEALRRFGKMSTRDLRREFDTDSTKVWHACRFLEGLGWVRRAGKDKNRIIWELTPKVLSTVLKDRVSFYDFPLVRKKEEIAIEKFGKKFKRWD
jgi:DNA-binding IclR family transcriptional regulator